MRPSTCESGREGQRCVICSPYPKPKLRKYLRETDIKKPRIKL